MTMESYLSAEDKARVEIDKMLEAAGWAVQDAREANLAAARAIRSRASRAGTRPPESTPRRPPADVAAGSR
jgi:type I site-specific restriction endonuclease